MELYFILNHFVNDLNKKVNNFNMLKTKKKEEAVLNYGIKR